MTEQGQFRVGGNTACMFVHCRGMGTPVCCEKCCWEARQVRTAACSAIESVVIAATAVLSGCPFDSSADEEIVESFLRRV